MMSYFLIGGKDLIDFLFRLYKFITDIHFSCIQGAAFMLGRALTSVPWGMVADRWGRKPVIIIGLASLLVVLIFLFTS